MMIIFYFWIEKCMVVLNHEQATQYILSMLLFKSVYYIKILFIHVSPMLKIYNDVCNLLFLRFMRRLFLCCVRSTKVRYLYMHLSKDKTVMTCLFLYVNSKDKQCFIKAHIYFFKLFAIMKFICSLIFNITTVLISTNNNNTVLPLSIIQCFSITI